MSVLYSDIPPLTTSRPDQTIAAEISARMANCDKLVIAVGYASQSSIEKLAELVEENHISDVTLVVGMYLNSGIPSSVYNALIKIQKKWSAADIGEIRLVNNMSYHGKLYTFWNNGKITKTIIGSANLSVLAPVGTQLRQYEISNIVDSPTDNAEIKSHLDGLISRYTVPIFEATEFKIIHERIAALKGLSSVTEVTDSAVSAVQEDQTPLRLEIPIKAPTFARRFGKESQDFARSNINVSYGAGRKNQNGKYDRRNWYEAQITVAKAITSQEDYPKDWPFYVVTDDGYQFECHTTAQNHKQLTAYGNDHNDRVFGRWIKGRLVTAGLLQAFDTADQDPDGLGIVTREMLQQAQMSTLVLTKTDRQEVGRVYGRNEKGRLDKTKWTNEVLDVWTIHFENTEEVD